MPDTWLWLHAAAHLVCIAGVLWIAVVLAIRASSDGPGSRLYLTRRPRRWWSR